MGRVKLEIKYREEFRARRATYITRMKGLKKKAGELSLLCGVDVLVASSSPELNAVEFWPEKDTPEFRRISERYLRFLNKKNDCDCNCSRDEGNGNREQQIPYPLKPSPSFSSPSFHEEMAAMEIKLKEVRERICFLQASSYYENLIRQRQEEEERLQAQSTISIPLQQDLHPLLQPSAFSQSLPAHLADFSPLEQPSPFSQSLPPHEHPSPFAHSLPPHLADFNLSLQQDLHPHEQLSSFALSPPLEQPFPFAQPLPNHLADFNTMDSPASLLPSDSPLCRPIDDLNWCDGLLLDYESGFCI